MKYPRTLGVKVTEETYRAFKEKCAEDGFTPGEVLRTLIDLYLNGEIVIEKRIVVRFSDSGLRVREEPSPPPMPFVRRIPRKKKEEEKKREEEEEVPSFLRDNPWLQVLATKA